MRKDARFALALGCLLASISQCDSGGHRAASRPPVREPADTPASLSSLETMRARLGSRYRLTIDRRVLLAARDLARLAGRGDAAVEARWTQDRFHLFAGREELGTLPERPTFAEELALLDGYARRLGFTAAAGPPPAGAPPAPLLALDVALRAAREAGARFHGTSPERAAVRDGLHALASLALSLPDAMGVADAVGARALALTAVAHATGVAAPADEALVAWAFGASLHARAVAHALPPNHPVALFVRGDSAGLDQLAPGDAARPLRLRQLLDARDRIGVRHFLDEQPARDQPELATVAARLESGAFEDILVVASDAPALLALHAQRDSGQDRAAEQLRAAASRGLRAVIGPPSDSGPGPLAWSLRELDGTLQRLPDGAALGPLLAGDAPGRDLWRATYRALAYDAIYATLRFAVDQRGDLVLADRLAAALGAAGSFSDAAPWVTLIAESRAGRRTPRDAADALGQLPFSNAAIGELLDRSGDHVDWGAPDAPALVAAAAAHLDGRPAHRAQLSNAAFSLLADLALVEAEGRAVVAEDPAHHPSTRLFLARLDGELLALRPWLRDADVAPAIKAELLGLLAADKLLPPAELVRETAALPADERRRFATVDKLARTLEDQGAYEPAQKLYAEFTRDGQHEALDVVRAQTGVARMLYHLKRFDEAWTVVAPLVRSGQRGAMARAALILQALGKADEAARLATEQHDRYPQVADSVGVLAEVLWRQGRHEDAARALASARLAVSDWRFQIGPHLLAAVDDGVDARAVSSALAAQHVDLTSMEGLANAVRYSKRHDALAMELFSALPAPGLMRLQTASEAAAILERMQGAKAASQWLERTVPVPMRAPLSQFVFREHVDGALWDVVPLIVPGPRELSDCVWLFRAGASLRAGASDPHRPEVRAYFERSDGTTRYFVLGRALLGLAPEGQALAQARDLKSSCEIAYWLGYKADVERRIGDAVTWYRIAVETGQSQVYEYRLAYDRLAIWRGEAKSLRRIAAGP